MTSLNSVSTRNEIQFGNNFAFRKRFERVDWRKIAAADIDLISRTLDFNTLQENILNITFCNVEAEMDTRLLDPNFIKLFRMAQLIIEYLLHSQEYLSCTINELKEKTESLTEKLNNQQKLSENYKQKLSNSRKESHKRKKMLMRQQHMMQHGTDSYHKCSFCEKTFMSAQFLQSHMVRRHAEVANQTSIAVVTPQKPVRAESMNGSFVETQGKNSDFTKELNELKEMIINNTNHATVEDEQEKKAALENEIQKWKKEFENEQKEKSNHMQNEFMKQLRELTARNEAAEEALKQLQKDKKSRSSNLGSIRDENDFDSNLLHQQKEELAMVKEQMSEQLKKEVFKVESRLNKEALKKETQHQAALKEIESNYQKQLKSMNDLHKEEITKLKNKNESQSTKNVSKNSEQKEASVEIHQQYENHMKEKTGMLSKAEPNHTPIPSPRVKPTHTYVRDYVSEEEETEDDLSDEQTDPIKVKQNTDALLNSETLQTTYSNQQINGTGNYSLNGTMSKNSRLFEELKNNPSVLEGMRQELKEVLQSELLQRGVPSGAAGIDNNKYKKIFSLLNQETQQKLKRFPNLAMIKEQYSNHIDSVANQKLRILTQNQNATFSTLNSTDAYDSRGSSQWTSDEEDGEEEDVVDGSPARQPATTQPPANHQPPRKNPAAQNLPPASPVRIKPVVPPREAPPTSHSHPVTSTPAASAPNQPAYQTDDLDESEWDSASELEPVSPTYPINNSQTGSKIFSSTQPKGSLVSNLTKSIENQLQNRGVNKPAGSVDTMSGGATTGEQLKIPKPSDFDDDDFSISSIEENLYPTNKRKSQTQPVRGSIQASTDISTNSFNTSLWGGSSRGVHSSTSCA